MSKATTKNDKNVSTKIVTATFENNLGPEQVSGVTFWRSFGFFDARKSKYSMEKVNFPENTQYHLNQSFLPWRKIKKFTVEIFSFWDKL